MRDGRLCVKECSETAQWLKMRQLLEVFTQVLARFACVISSNSNNYGCCLYLHFAVRKQAKILPMAPLVKVEFEFILPDTRVLKH